MLSSVLSTILLAAVAATTPIKGSSFITIGQKPADGEIYWTGDRLVGHYGEKDYGWNNNCRVLDWGGRWNTPDGSKKNNALVECILRERKVAWDVRKLGHELDCASGNNREQQCTREHSESKSLEQSVDFGFKSEGFSMGVLFKTTLTTSDSKLFSFTDKCWRSEGRFCTIGGKALIEYEMYIGWVHWDSWRYPSSKTGPQWLNAGNEGGGMWDYRNYNKYAYDGGRETGWYTWAGTDADCDVYGQTNDYELQCSLAKSP